VETAREGDSGKVDALLKGTFRTVYQNLLGEEGDDEEEGAWGRFRESEAKARATALAVEMAQEMVPGISRAAVMRRLKPLFDVIWGWAGGELAEQVFLEADNSAP